MTNISIRIPYENKLFNENCAWTSHLCTSGHLPCITLCPEEGLMLNLQMLNSIQLFLLDKSLPELVGITVTNISVLCHLGLSQLKSFRGTHSMPIKASAGKFLKPGFLEKYGLKIMWVMFQLSMKKQQLMCAETVTKFLTDLFWFYSCLH